MQLTFPFSFIILSLLLISNPYLLFSQILKSAETAEQMLPHFIHCNLSS